ncbi:MAG: hypothetical protein ACXVEE_35905 [Polyangiales bacterium]
MLAVSQYWADEAEDAVHATLAYSQRDTPLWPHDCEWGDREIPGEACGSCVQDHALEWMRGWDDNGAAIEAFQPWCHEHGSQDESEASNAMPFAIARMRDGRIEVDQVGPLLRGWLEVGGASASHPRDPRANELLALVHAEPESDSPRRVLADHLLEIGDPLGEFIALSLLEPSEGGSDVEARRKALLEAHASTWLGPLVECVPLVSAGFERGFLARCDVYLDGDSARFLSLPEWATVEELRFLPGSAHFIAATMTALRRVGPLGRAGLYQLSSANRPWKLEELHAVIEDTDDVYTLLQAKTLPSLRRLVLAGPRASSAFAALRAENPFDRLERVELCLEPDAHDTAAVRTLCSGLSRDPRSPTLALSVARMNATPAGWVFERRGDDVTVTMNGWSDVATIENLQFLVRGVPQELSFRVAPSRFWAPTRVDVERIAQVNRRRVEDMMPR